MAAPVEHYRDLVIQGFNKAIREGAPLLGHILIALDFKDKVDFAKEVPLNQFAFIIKNFYFWDSSGDIYIHNSSKGVGKLGVHKLTAIGMKMAWTYCIQVLAGRGDLSFVDFNVLGDSEGTPLFSCSLGEGWKVCKAMQATTYEYTAVEVIAKLGSALLKPGFTKDQFIQETINIAKIEGLELVGPESSGASGAQTDITLEGGFDRAYKELETKAMALGLTPDEADFLASGQVGKTSREDILMLMAVDQYVGFDPLVTVREMLARAKSAKAIATQEFTINDKKTSYVDTEPTDAEHTRRRATNDARWLITLFVTRGTNFKKQSAKMSIEAARLNGDLLTRYSIPRAPRTSGKAISAEVITLPRIAATFCPDVCRLANKGLVKMMVDPTELDAADSIPKCLFTTSMPSLIPKDEATYEYAKPLLMLARWVSLRFDDRIKSQNRSNLSSYQQMDQFIEAARNNQLYTDKARNNFLIGLHVVTAQGKLPGPVSALCAKADSKYTQLKNVDGQSRGLKAQANAGLEDMIKAAVAEAMSAKE